ncbi:MAG: endolytic transglycosylase MltG [Clostridia bacterium]|nr:endolytic transglycosylase MltG [Clostridia bacterium]
MSNYNYRNNRRNDYDRGSSGRYPSYSRRDVYHGIWKFLRSILIVLSAFLLVLSGIYFGTDYFLNHYWLPTSETDTTPVVIEIPKGTAVSSIAQILHENGLVNNAKVFEYYIDFSGYSKKMQAGEYIFNKTMSMQEIMEMLAEGNGPMQVTEFLIIEGSSITVTAQKLLSDGVISDVDAFLAAASDVNEYTSSYNFIADVAAIDNPDRPYLLEGYLYPAKYEIYVGSSESTIIKKMLNKFSEIFNEKRLARAEELGLTVDEVVILASIIERESRPNDFSKVSAVFYNRIVNGMKLESCASVQYILGTNKIKLSNEDISIDSKYNTYLYAGLPAGPICSPSERAIDAALYPDEAFMDEGYLFFATKDPESGELAFSKTADEHAAVVAQYEDLWIEYDREHGN